MTEFKAHAMVFSAMMALLAVASLVLISLDANSNLLVLAFILILGGAADTSSRVVMHYAESERRRR